MAEYVVGQKSAHRIAREVGCSHSTILKYLHDFGIKIRKDLDKYQRGQLPYGVQVVEGEVVAHEAERAVIEKIQLLRAQGFSYHRVADILNTLGVQTKKKKSRWHGTTVMKITKKLLDPL